jgi:hypothetical protein
VQTLRASAPRVAHIDTSRPEAPVARPLAHEISRVVRGRGANPKWIAGVMRHGYKGAFEIAAYGGLSVRFRGLHGMRSPITISISCSPPIWKMTKFAASWPICQSGGAARDGGALCRSDSPGSVDAAFQSRCRSDRRTSAAGTQRDRKGNRMTGTAHDEAAENARHKEKAAKHKAAKDKIMATKVGEKGLLIVHTGTGKGKTSAALGMVFRHIGHGYPVGIVQFTKSPEWDTGEARC